MALTATQTAYLNKRLGLGFDAVDAEARATRLGTVEAAAVEILEERISTMLTKPLNFTIPGDYAEDRTGNLSALRDQLETAQDEAGVNAAASTLRAVQPALSRWAR